MIKTADMLRFRGFEKIQKSQKKDEMVTNLELF